jgi:hypothetical protein
MMKLQSVNKALRDMFDSLRERMPASFLGLLLLIQLSRPQDLIRLYAGIRTAAHQSIPRPVTLH